MLEEIAIFIAVGFAAQMVDGALGMAYGLTATSVLLSFGTAPATASASVHAAELFTTAASGAAHWRFGNIDRRMLWRLALPGMAGAFVGAYTLVSFPGELLRPYVAAYLLLAGVIVLVRGLRHDASPRDQVTRPAGIVALWSIGLTGGFLDAVGGGGWGALVTSSLIGLGIVPRIAIGTVSLTEFFVTAAASATFFGTIGLSLWPVILGLVVGGVIAAPLAAYAARHLDERPLMMLVGSLIIVLSLRQIARALLA